VWEGVGGCGRPPVVVDAGVPLRVVPLK